MKGSNKTIGFANLLFIVIILSVALTSVTYAWLTMNKKVDSDGLVFQIDDSQGIGVQSFDIYKRNGKTGAQRVTGKNVDMTEYDTIFTDRNVDTPVIMRIVLGNFPKDDTTGMYIKPDIEISASCGDFWRGDDDWSDGSWTDTGYASGKLTKSLSNLATLVFSAGNKTLDEADVDDAVTIYEGAVALMDGSEDAKGFAKVAYSPDEGYSNVKKVRTISQTILSSDYNLTDVDQDGLPEVVMYCEITYNPSNIAAYMEQNPLIIEDESKGDDMIAFTNDIKNISFKFDTD